VEVKEAANDLAAALALRSGEEIVSRQQVRYIDGAAWSLRTSFCSRRLVAQGAERLLGSSDIEIGVVAYLEETLALRYVGCQDRIQVRPPSGDEARLFKLADDGRVSMMIVHRTCYAADGEALLPFLVMVTVFPADRNQLLAVAGMVPISKSGILRIQSDRGRGNAFALVRRRESTRLEDRFPGARVDPDGRGLADLRRLVAGSVRAPGDDEPVGASAAELAVLSDRLGRSLPLALRNWLSVCRGAAIGPGGVFGERPDRPSLDMAGIRDLYPDWRTLGWLPVAGDGCGNYYVLAQGSAAPG
jgi:hypothetical protein